VVAYRIEGFEMFDQMVSAIREDTARMLLTVRIQMEGEPKREQVAQADTASVGGDGSEKGRTVRKSAAEKIGRNDPCPCGSGLKYKKCCGKGE
jgi:preprotein translocase subunit SecA